MNINDLGKKYKDYLIEMRREFHMYPETSFEEFRTSKRIKEELEKINVPYEELAKTGILATIKGAHPGKTVALRADMDALDIQETNNVSYKSKYDGKMHACGHDGHVAMLLGAAHIFMDLRDSLKGTIKLIFQPSEENGKGAKKMLEESNFMDQVDSVFAIHLWNNLDIGKISVEEGPRMASADYFDIHVSGKAGHGSMPHQTVDAVLVASSIVMNLQSFVSREISPFESAVLSIGSLHAGTTFNIIAGDAKLSGTSRCFTSQVRGEFPKAIERISKSTAATYRANAELTYHQGPPPTINEKESSQIAKTSVEKILGLDGLINMEKTTGAEDFAYFLEKAPGLLAFVGTRNKEKNLTYPHHHDKFDIDEDALVIGSMLYVQYALDFMNN